MTASSGPMYLQTAGKRRSRRRTQRGAALIFTLVATLIISIVLGGVWTYVASHVAVEESSRDYSRAIYYAEAAANWQLNHMARVLPSTFTGTPPTGYMTASAFNTTFNPYVGQLPSTDTGVQIGGWANVTVHDKQSNNIWHPPHDFTMIAKGYINDPNDTSHPNIARSVKFDGTATGLADRFTLFGQSSLNFRTGPTYQCQVSGWIGSNAYVYAQNTTTVRDTKFFGGVMLGKSTGGTQATISPDAPNWFTVNPKGIIDIARLPDRVYWPSVDDVFRNTFGGVPSSLTTANANGQVYRLDIDGSGNKSWVVVTGSAANALNHSSGAYSQDMSNGQHCKVVRLKLNANGTNVFRFTDINMNSDDTLILDLNPDSTGQSAALAMRIVLDGATTDAKITNLAYRKYFSSPPASGNLHNSQVLWYNDSTHAMVFQPANPATSTFDEAPVSPDYNFTCYPSTGLTLCLYGLVYSPGADVQVKSVDSSHPVLVNSIVANNLTLDLTAGTISAGLPSSNIENADDPHRYALYYRVMSSYYEATLADAWSTGNPVVSPYTYGAFP